MKTVPDSPATRQAIIDACLWMNRAGLNQSTSGNISLRTRAGVLITPSGIPYEDLTPELMVVIPHDGPLPPDMPVKPSSEWLFHQRVLRERPDMVALIHAHPPYCSTLAVQRRAIPACHYMVAAFGGADVPLCPYAMFGTDALADALADTLSDRHGCLMANHGATVLGETLDKARWRLEELEALARTYLFSHIGGAPHILTDAEIAEVAVAFRSYGPRPADG